MKDTAIKNTGNSRFLRSNVAEDISFSEFIALLRAGQLPIDLAGVNMDGVDILGTALNKANLLRDETALRFGLDENAVPDDAFAFLGKYNLHWWSLLHGEASIGYEEVRTAYANPHHSSNANEVCVRPRINLEYSTSITIDQDTGEITLNNPTAVTPYSSEISSVSNALKGKYVTGLWDSLFGETLIDGVIYVPTSSTIVMDEDDSEGYYSTIKNVYSVNSQVYNIPASATTYVYSADRSAYPDSGEVDGITYTYLGVPFDNAVTAPRIETGSYTGVGTYGSSNENTLTFDFVPKLVVISGGSTTRTLIAVAESTGGVAVHYTPNVYVSALTCTWNNTVFSWYSTNDAEKQLNQSGSTYYYIAIG